MSDRRGSWMQTFTGKQFFPIDPRPSEVDILDIAHALSNICRYNGHSLRFYSVAEHSVIVSHAVPPECALHGLLHDAAEAYVGDMIRPLKSQAAFAGFTDAEDQVADAIAQRFDYVWSPSALAEIKDADNRILLDERDQIMAPAPASWGLDGMQPLGVTINGWSPRRAESEFLIRFAELARDR